jgi:hypothetical protein
MSDVARPPRRLPGIRFETVAPPLADVLPRMDVAAFVGFAARGPLDTPVAVEDPDGFAAVFGDDLPLAWDPVRGETVSAYLAPCVRAFFANGGRRCWVIRVAGSAVETSLFPIPGLAELQPGADGGPWRLVPGTARARSPGSWADPIAVASALGRETIGAGLLDAASGLLTMVETVRAEVQPGDLLRLAAPGTPEFALGVVEAVVAGSTTRAALYGSPPVAIPPRIAVRPIGWFSEVWPLGSPPTAAGQAFRYWLTDSASPGVEPAEQHDLSWIEQAPVPARLAAAVGPAAGSAAPSGFGPFDLDLPWSEAPAPGSLLRLDFDGEEGWLTVEATATEISVESPPTSVVRVFGGGLRRLPDRPSTAAGPLGVERLSVDLLARRGDAHPVRLRRLGCAPAHPRYWRNLPTDAQAPTDRTAPLVETARLLGEAWALDFPVAGGGASNAVFIPVGMSAVASPYSPARHSGRAALARDGLERFCSELFLDPALREPTTSTLLAEANYVRAQSPNPRELRGIHAALAVEEATLLAVPDALHAGWEPVAAAAPLAPRPSSPPARPEWWHFADCRDPARVKLVSEPEWGHFFDCTMRVVPRPVLSAGTPDATGTFDLWWVEATPDTTYRLEEATEPDFVGAVPLPVRGAVRDVVAGESALRLTLRGRAPRDYYYRVRAEVGGAVSDWSDPILVRVAGSSPWRIRPFDAAAEVRLLAIQRSMLRLSAARGDMLAVLALPPEYREPETLAYVNRLRSPADTEGFADERVLPLGYGEADAFSYGAVYHPWPLVREAAAAPVRRLPPDGAAAGVLASRTLDRGAWIAPANVPYRGILALTPSLTEARWPDLLAANVNVLWHEPRGFLTLSEDTLRDDPELRPINVRRLLSLLRRVALQRGAQYVFEPNDDTFRRSVQRGFESLLDDLFRRGAFAGASAADAYRVSVDATLNPPTSVDQGRLVIELRVAPSRPLTFLTVRLVQLDGQTTVTEGR